MRNKIIEKVETHVGLTDERIAEILASVCADTGFAADEEIQRRFIYDREKTWRVRVGGSYQGKPASLRIETLQLEIDEEPIRETFRARAASAGTKVRPPQTYASARFTEERGYGWSIDELVGGTPLFDGVMPPAEAVAAFVPFYRELHRTAAIPFWPAENMDAHAFTQAQTIGWMDLASKRDGVHANRFAKLTARLAERLFEGMRGRMLQFGHPHLAGPDVRVIPGGEWVVFANHFWSWRQPGYPVTFPLWWQWLALPDERRTPDAVAEITETWLAAVERGLSDIISIEDVRTLLFSRLIGSLLLDGPAQKSHRIPESIAALEAALVAESHRLLG